MDEVLFCAFLLVIGFSNFIRCKDVCKDQAGFAERCRDLRGWGYCQLKKHQEAMRHYCKKSCDFCVTGGPVDGNWSKFSNWGACTKTCGKGKRVRLRGCNSPKPSNGGKECVGNRKEEEDCIVKPCPVHGRWSKFSSWSKCTKSCGTGKRTRSRKCDNPGPAHGGEKCVGKLSQVDDCNKQPCPDLTNLALRKPVHQSSNYNLQFTAENAVDGSKSTKSVTKRDAISWWSVDLTREAQINQITLHLHTYAFRTGQYKNFKVETRIRYTDEWQLCKEVTVTQTKSPLIVQCDVQTPAIHVKISVQPKVYLSLVEVKVQGRFLSDISNLALKKPAQQSSDHSSKFRAGNAVDGSTSTKSVTGKDDISWWSVDLTREARIDRFLFFLHSYAYSKGQYNDFKVETRIRQTDDWHLCKEVVVTSPKSALEVHCKAPTTARYVRISVQKNLYLYLSEVKVLGTYLTATTTTTTTTTTPSITAGPSCGRDKGDGGRVYGGVDAAPHRWEWQGGIFYQDFTGTPKFVCGGSLIESNLFLTAAHCVEYRTDKSKMFIRLGDHNSDEKEEGEQDIKVKEIVYHKDWYVKPWYHDIAIIQLADDAKLGDTVGTICLPGRNIDPQADSTCFVTGWGKLGQNEMKAEILQEAELPIIQNDVCGKRNVDKKAKSRIGPGMICGGYVTGKETSACPGDSGGPYVCKKDSRWVLQGIVSWGSKECKSSRRYTVFTRVNKYIDWISEQRKLLKA